MPKSDIPIDRIIPEGAPGTLTPEEKNSLLTSISSGEVDDDLDAIEALDAIDDES